MHCIIMSLIPRSTPEGGICTGQTLSSARDIAQTHRFIPFTEYNNPSPPLPCIPRASSAQISLSTAPLPSRPSKPPYSPPAPGSPIQHYHTIRHTLSLLQVAMLHPGMPLPHYRKTHAESNTVGKIRLAWTSKMRTRVGARECFGR
jgi:hypothetical protein